MFACLWMQTGENLVPEQTDEREEAEKRESAVLHQIPPVLMHGRVQSRTLRKPRGANKPTEITSQLRVPAGLKERPQGSCPGPRCVQQFKTTATSLFNIQPVIRKTSREAEVMRPAVKKQTGRSASGLHVP